jgi:hypothetical protein
MGDHEAARRYAEEAMRETSMPAYRGAAQAFLSGPVLKLGDAERAAREAEGAAGELGLVPALRGYAYTQLAAARLAQGRADAALAASSEAIRISDAFGGLKSNEPRARFTHAAALEASGERERAQAERARAKAILRANAEAIADPRYRASYLAQVDEPG